MVEVLDAVANVGPVGLLAFALLMAIWQLGPIAKDFVSKVGLRLDANNQALLAVKGELTNSNKVNEANAQAIGGLAETISQLAASVNSVQFEHGKNQLQLSTSQETLAKHFNRSTDILSLINDRMGTQSTQMDLVIGDTTATRADMAATKNAVSEIQANINNGVDQLGKIAALLEEMKAVNKQHQCVQPADLNKLIEAWGETRREILSVITELKQGNSQPETAVPSNN